MKVFVVAIGTRGDFEQFFLLARELRDRGHTVAVGTSGFYLDRLKEAKLGWARIGDGTREQLVSVLQSLAAAGDIRQRTGLYEQRWLRPQLTQGRGDITAIGAGTDYFISNVKMALRHDGVTVPGAFVTYDPPEDVSDLSRYGSRSHAGRILELVSMPKALVDPDGTWGPEYRFAGFWQGRSGGDWTPDERLGAFLEAGDPPVVLTMGSMAMFDPAALASLFGQALALAGRRGVLIGSWSGMDRASPLGEHVCCVPEAPYDWLLARASCVIHHGGCGTVAAALRAGTPSIVCPQLLAQERFGQLLADAGLAAAVLDIASLDPATLAEALMRATSDASLARTAARWREAISREDGVAAAADLIEDHWKGIATRA